MVVLKKISPHDHVFGNAKTSTPVTETLPIWNTINSNKNFIKYLRFGRNKKEKAGVMPPAFQIDARSIFTTGDNNVFPIFYYYRDFVHNLLELTK